MRGPLQERLGRIFETLRKNIDLVDTVAALLGCYFEGAS